MNYPEGIRKKYNECMYEERDMFAMNNAHEIMQGIGGD